MRTSSRHLAAAALTVLMGSMMVPVAAHADATPLFKQLVGSWQGSGDLELENGVKERLSCKGYYVLKSEGEGLSIATLCSSPTQKFEIRSLVADTTGGITGKWEERTFNAAGEVSGNATDKTMNLSISGPIEGTIAISIAGKTHSVSITAAGAGIKGVSISLTRA